MACPSWVEVCCASYAGVCNGGVWLIPMELDKPKSIRCKKVLTGITVALFFLAGGTEYSELKLALGGKPGRKPVADKGLVF